MLSFSKDDSCVVSYILESVFPMIHHREQMKWLRGVIISYHKWNGFFTNEKWHKDNINGHHNSITKEVGRRKAILRVINDNDRDYITSRKRMNDDYFFIIKRMGMEVSCKYWERMAAKEINSSEKSTVDRCVAGIMAGLRETYHSDDPMMKCHYYFVVARLYKEMKDQGKLRSTVSMDALIDHVTFRVM